MRDEQTGVTPQWEVFKTPILQVHSEEESRLFFSRPIKVICGRFERIEDIGGKKRTAWNVVFYREDIQKIFVLLDYERYPFPVPLCSFPEVSAPSGFSKGNVDPPFDLSELNTVERHLPGVASFYTMVDHLKRYAFGRANLKPGTVLDIACGTGYGTNMMLHRKDITRGVGVDKSDSALRFCKLLVTDPRAEFHQTLPDESFDNVVCIETLEHVPDPFEFMEQLGKRLRPDGQFIISLPNELYYGAHGYMSSFHFSNWNQRRIINFFTALFRDVTLYFQRHLAPAADRLSTYEISAKPWAGNENGHFIVVAKGLQTGRKKRLVIRRTGSLGQVIWTTPVVEQIKNNNPAKHLCVVTDRTEVFVSNPYTDVVVTAAWPGQVDIDLDLAEKPGEPVHVLEAYKKKAELKQVIPQPRLFYTSHAERAQTEAKKVIACHPLASPPERIWPEKNWRELIEKLKQEYYVVLVGGAKDFNVKTPGAYSFLDRGLNLFATAAVIEKADLFVGLEASDLCDVAAAVQTPCVVLLGAVSAQIRLPQTGGSIGISSPPGSEGAGMDAITVEMVIEAIKKRLGDI